MIRFPLFILCFAVSFNRIAQNLKVMPDTPPTVPAHCSVCDAPLEPDAVCLACAFDIAFASDVGNSEAKPAMASEGGFGDFAPPAGGTFGKYRLNKELGSGGMGVIWEAEDTNLHRTVAIKMIRGFAFSSARERQRFQREAMAVAQLDHPNIVPIYESGEIDGQPYFAMKRLSGGTLSARMANGPMGQREAAAIMEKLARALAHAHGRGVLHRDLKPDNVIFDDDGKPHLADFGLAKLLDEGDGLTLTTAHVGTPHYMSPEQARGRAKDITALSDIWGAGALLYHMLTGHPPFTGESSGEILHHVANDKPRSMDDAVPAVDKDLRTVCLRCLARDPAQRMPSAEVLADELARWLDGRPLETRSTRSLRPAALVVSLLVIAAVAGSLFLNSNREPEPVGSSPGKTDARTQLDAIVHQFAPGANVAIVFLEGDRRLHSGTDHGAEVHVRVNAEGTAIIENTEQKDFEFLKRNELLVPKFTRGWFGNPQDAQSDVRAIHFTPGLTGDTPIWGVHSKAVSSWGGDIVIHTGSKNDDPFFRATNNLIPYGTIGHIVRVSTNEAESRLGIAHGSFYLSDRGRMDLCWEGEKGKISNSHTAYYLPAGTTLRDLGLRPGTSKSWDDDVFGRVTLLIQPWAKSEIPEITKEVSK